MINLGKFTSHAGIELDWKIECDDLSEADIEALAYLVSTRVRGFSSVVGVPTGGFRLAVALEKYVNPEFNITLIVDDVLTTGRSMNEMRDAVPGASFGVVIFSRGRVPDWITPIFRTSF